MKKFQILSTAFSLIFTLNARGQIYSPDKQLVYTPLSKLSKPGYLLTVPDAALGSYITRIGNNGSMGGGQTPYHVYAKQQPWNSDGSLIIFQGWPSAILDGNTYAVKKSIMPPAGYCTWSNTQPNIIYGSDNNNKFVKIDVNTGIKTVVHTFSEYTSIDYGLWEGNMSNDDRYVALFCSSGLTNYVICYDLVNDLVVSKSSTVTDVNNCAMSQDGNYVLIQYNTGGSGIRQGIWAHRRSDMSVVRSLSSTGGGHYDIGFDTKGNEVIVVQNATGGNSALIMVRIDNGKTTTLLSADKMGWPIHISCRNINRPGWAYISDFSASYEEPNKANYQKMFAVKLDTAATGNAVTETFAFTRHQVKNEIYNHSAFGVPNRDGSVAMFRSDWGDPNGEVDSYVATSIDGTGGSADTVAPAVPTGLKVTNIGSSSCSLTWNPSSDNIGIAGYNVYSNGILVVSTDGPGRVITVTGLTCNSVNIITGKARDAYGNLSSASVPIEVTTLSCSSTDGYRIRKTSVAPLIDGLINEFGQADSVSFSIPSGAKVIANAMWDNTSLYVAARVGDNQLNASVTTRDGAVWEEDAFELFLDNDHSKGSSMDSDDYHFLMNILNKQCDVGPGALLSWNGSWQSEVIFSGTRNSNGDTDKGYTLELAIPWTIMGFSSPPEAGRIVGLDFAIDDKQASGLKYIMWPSITASFQSPDNWQQAFLGDDITTGFNFKAVKNLTDVEIYPNPASTTISIKNVPIGAHISAFSVNGMLMKQKIADSKITDVDINEWSKGVYFLKIQTDNNIIIKKVIHE